MKGLEAKTLGLKKVIRHEYKRIVAFMLTVAMVVTNFGTNLTVAFAAGEETSSLFLLDSSELEDAISTALESGDVFDFSSLELKAKQKSLKTSYEKLIGSKAGKVYQLDVDVDSSYASENTDLQVFYNAGTDSVVFLFINESDMTVTFRANVSGYETARVTVNPNTSNIEDAEGVENAEDYSNTTMVDDEKKAKAEVVKPEGETSETDENGSDETEEETKADVTESETASENGETEETTGAENSSETEETTAAEETEAEVEETAEENEAAEPETEAPAAEEELQAEEGSATASISAKEVFRVSTSAEVAEETLADSTEEETEAETEAEAPEKETEALPETTEAEETVADDKTEETAADESKADETTAADETADGETVADETKDGELVNDETEAPADNNGDSSEVDFDGDEQFLEDDSIELMGELAGKAYNTVTIWGRANARAYAVKAEDLVGEAAVEGQYNVDYSVDPVGAAAIKGAHTVNEGETLYFAVDPQVGYEITEVTANGEELEEVDAAGVASASNLEKYAHVYAVEEVSEDLEIVASLEETENVAHPEFNASYVSSDGVTISLHAEEGILPEGTELDVTEVTEAIGDTIKEKMESESEGAAVNKVLAYDINLLYNGEKLSNSWSEDGYVDVTFTGVPIQEMTETSDKVEIVAVDDTSKTQLTAEKAEAVEASELKLESVSEQSVEGEAVEEVGFKAEHFTIYAITGSNGTTKYQKLHNMTVAASTSTLNVYSDKQYSEHYEWISDDTNVIKIQTQTSNSQNGKTYPAATLKVVGKGTAVIEYGYYEWKQEGWKWIQVWNRLDIAAINVGKEGVQVNAKFFYLKTSTSDPDSNDTKEWCDKTMGTGVADITGAVWDSTGKNTLDEVPNRVVSWPDGNTGSSYVVPENTTEWNAVFEALRKKKDGTVQDIKKEDISQIILHPYKISRNNDGYHVDCTVEPVIKNRYTATYKLWDANGTGYEWKEATEYNQGDKTSPSRKLQTECKSTKTYNNVNYTFKGWYDNPELEGDAIKFPYEVTSNVTFYAKYIGGYNVIYDLAGGTWSLVKKVYPANEGDWVTVETVKPKKAGYTFAGWTCSEAEHKFHSGDSEDTFEMPNHDVTLTAKWEPSTNNKITVKHFFQNADGSYPAEETLTADNVQVITSLTTGDPVYGATYDKSPITGYTYNVEESDLEKFVAADGSTVLRLYYTINAHRVIYQYDPADQPEGAQSQLPDTKSYAYGTTVSLERKPTLPGYTFKGWTADETDLVGADGKFSMPDHDVTLKGYFEANKNTSYKVEFYYQKADGTYPREEELDVAKGEIKERTGTTGKEVSVRDADKDARDGFAYTRIENQTCESGIVKADGSLRLKLYFKKQFTVTYLKGDKDKGNFDPQEIKNQNYGVRVPACPIDPDADGNHKAGYHFVRWNPTYDENATVTDNMTFIAQWAPDEDVSYVVRYFYQNANGIYIKKNSDVTRNDGTTGSGISVTDADKTPDRPEEGADYRYALDETQNAKWTQEVLGDGSTVLEVYFKRQYKVTYDPGEKGTFTRETSEWVDHGATRPAFSGNIKNPAGEAGWKFTGWTPELEDTVTKTVTYKANWAAKTDTAYTVERYFQKKDGTYSISADSSIARSGRTNDTARLTEDDFNSGSVSYVCDKTRTVDGLAIRGDGKTVLKVYFKLQLKVTYDRGAHGDFDTYTVDEAFDYNADTPAFNGNKTADGKPKGEAGWQFVGWKPEWNSKVTEDVTYVAQWTAEEVPYVVEYYYENKGQYLDSEKVVSAARNAHTDDAVSVTADDKTPDLSKGNYELDERDAYKANWSGKVAGDGTLHLKVYFRQVFTVTYTKGAKGTFEPDEHPGLHYGDQIPSFNGDINKHEPGYSFAGWNKTIAETVTKDEEYKALWNADSKLYRVEYYFQDANGQWPTTANYHNDRSSQTGMEVGLDLPGDVTPGTIYPNHVYDENKTKAENSTKADGSIGGVIPGEGTLVLKVYFKLQFTVKYLKGSHGTFAEETKENLEYGVRTPKFEGNITGEDGYTFVGWSPEVAANVTENAEYVAQWSGLNVTKVVTDHLSTGDAFVEGNTIHFEITVENIGDVALKDVIVKDTLADTDILPAQAATGNYNVVNGEAQIGTLAARATVKVYASHVVTADDVANKAFKNTAVVSHTNPVDPEGEKPEIPTKTEVIPTKGVKVEKTVTSTAPAADGKYVLGDKVTFAITVTNTGNTELNDFRVVDQLKNTTILNGEGYTVTADAEGHAVAVVNGLAVDASITIAAEHIVAEEDLRKEHFKNVAVAELTDPQNPDNPKKEEDETPDIPKVDADANWKVTKTVTNLPSRGYFHSGEVAEFNIKVENTGNQTLNDIVVADLLSGAELKAGSGYTLNANGTATIATLNVGAAVTLKAAYKVTSADATNKKFVNAATATIGTETETGTTGDIPTGTTDNGGNSGGGGNGGGNGGGGGGSSSGGGGGSSSGPRDNGSTPSGGPGTTTVTIDPDAVPLANLPNEDGAADLLVIDDEDVPLAALPKTGQSGASGLVLFLSSMMLAAFVAVSKKREDDK